MSALARYVHVMCAVPSQLFLSLACTLRLTAMPDVFLPELISEVISHLDPANIQDLHTLTACNLVSLTFSTASSAVLFHTICISTELTVHGFYERSVRNDAAISDLKSILSQSPHLSELVRVIYLDNLERNAWKMIQIETGNTPLLTSFCNVQSLYIFGWAGFPAYNMFQKISSAFQSFVLWPFRSSAFV